MRYIFLDVNFDIRVDGSIEKVPELVAIGFAETGQKLDFGFQTGDKESASPWREFFKNLKGRV
ncbi:MAG: transposase [Thermodesulfobacteriota bacterium]|nr:transposase [Thermodesulfobacteriota bacterium]